MKFMFISDIHGSFLDLQQAIKVFESEKADKLIILGDYLNHGPRNPLPEGYDTKQSASLLNEYKKKIIGIRGNCDSEVDQMMLEFPVLESSCRIFMDDISVYLHHGHKNTPEELSKFLPAKTVVLSGHTHIPKIQEENSLIFVNPGSISIPKSENGKCYGILSVEEDKKSIEIKGLFDSLVKKCLLF